MKGFGSLKEKWPAWWIDEINLAQEAVLLQLRNPLKCFFQGFLNFSRWSNKPASWNLSLFVQILELICICLDMIACERPLINLFLPQPTTTTIQSTFFFLVVKLTADKNRLQFTSGLVIQIYMISLVVLWRGVDSQTHGGAGGAFMRGSAPLQLLRAALGSLPTYYHCKAHRLFPTHPKKKNTQKHFLKSLVRGLWCHDNGSYVTGCTTLSKDCHVLRINVAKSPRRPPWVTS